MVQMRSWGLYAIKSCLPHVRCQPVWKTHCDDHCGMIQSVCVFHHQFVMVKQTLLRFFGHQTNSRLRDLSQLKYPALPHWLLFPPLLSSSSPSSALIKSCSDTWMMNSFMALTFLPRTTHPIPCRWDRDRWRYLCTFGCQWGHEAVAQWN